MDIDTLFTQLDAATRLLSVDDLGNIVDHLGYGSLAEIRAEPRFKPIVSFLPTDDDPDAIHTLWVLLTQLHSDQFIQRQAARN